MSVTFKRRTSYTSGDSWSTWKQFTRECGFLDLGVTGGKVWFEYSEINIPAGEQYKIVNNGFVLLDMTGPVVDGSAFLEYGAGTPSGSGAWSEEVVCPACDDDSDCGPCEKCVDGECVPCEQCSDGLGQLILYCNDPINGDLVKVVDIDWSLSDQDNVNIGMALYGYSYRLTCPKGFEDGIITITEYWEETATGINTDPVVRQVNTIKGKKYVDIQIADYFTRIDMFGPIPGFCSFTGKVHIGWVGDDYGTCADDLGDDPGEPVKPPPTSPPPAEPPEKPTGGDEPEEIDEPLPPEPVTPLPPEPQPPEPQTGCECEIYQAKMILSGLQEVRNSIINHQNQIDARLADGDRVLFARLTSMERTIYQQLAQTNRLLYQLSYWFGNNFFAEFKQLRESVAQVSDDITDIRDSLRLPPCEPDYPDGKTISEIADEFVQKYEPVDVVVEESDVWQQSPDEAPRNYPRKL